MTTTHANNPKEALARLETLCLMADVELPLRAIRAQLAASIHLIVQQTRDSDGFRGITHVSEVAGLGPDGELLIEDVFRRRRNPNGKGSARATFELTGYVPTCLWSFVEADLVDDAEYL